MDIPMAIEFQERDLIGACIRREEWALRLVYEENYSLMMSICLRFAANESDAMDLLHDGYIKVINNFEKYVPGTSFTSWIHRLMVNSCIDHFRKMTRRRTEDIDQVNCTATVDPDAVSICTEKEILNAIQKLSPTYRTVFVLAAIEGYSHKDISQELGITESTSRSNLVKARQRLQELLKETIHMRR